MRLIKATIGLTYNKNGCSRKSLMFEKQGYLTQHLRRPPFFLQCFRNGDVFSKDLHSFAHLLASSPRINLKLNRSSDYIEH